MKRSKGTEIVNSTLASSSCSAIVSLAGGSARISDHAYSITGAAATAGLITLIPEGLVLLMSVTFAVAAVAILIHGSGLFASLTSGGTINVSLLSSVSLIGLLLAIIGTLAAFDPDLRGVAAGLIVLAAPTALATQAGVAEVTGSGLTWQLQTHVFTALFAYGLLAAGAIVAIYALVQDHRLRAAKLSNVNQLFAPLEKTERVLYGVASAGVAVLAMSMALGITFVDNLFAQHLVHKTVLSLLALLVFGILLAGAVLGFIIARVGIPTMSSAESVKADTEQERTEDEDSAKSTPSASPTAFSTASPSRSRRRPGCCSRAETSRSTPTPRRRSGPTSMPSPTI